MHFFNKLFCSTLILILFFSRNHIKEMNLIFSLNFSEKRELQI